MTVHFDALEARPPEMREAALLARLPGLVGHAQKTAGFARIFAGVDARTITSRAALAQLPVTRKSELKALQEQAPPFGGLSPTRLGELRRVYMSPGPIFEPEGNRDDYWRFARALYAIGVRPGDLIQNCFSYHFTPAAFMVEGGAQRLDCPILPAGSGSTEMQVQAMAALHAPVYVGAPSFLKIIIEKAQELGTAVSFKRALVGGEALPPSLRAWFTEHGMPLVMQLYATADLGSIAYETCSEGTIHPGMVLDEDVLLEIVRPGTGDPLAPGEVGEVLVTSFNPDYPLVRFATGDLSAILPGASPCGRTNVRIRGWLGRADQTTKVRAMFVQPAQVNEIVRRHGEIVRARLVVTGALGVDEMTLYCEVDEALAGSPDPARMQAIELSIREVTKLRGAVRLVTRGSLPNDGKVISDERSYA